MKDMDTESRKEMSIAKAKARAEEKKKNTREDRETVINLHQGQSEPLVFLHRPWCHRWNFEDAVGRSVAVVQETDIQDSALSCQYSHH